MTGLNLTNACNSIHNWCDSHHINYDIIYAKPDLEGIIIYNNDALEEVQRMIKPIMLENKLNYVIDYHDEWSMLIVSPNSISEATTNLINDCYQEEPTMKLKEKISSIFNQSGKSSSRKIEAATDKPMEIQSEIDFDSDALSIFREAQRKSAISGMARGKYKDDMIHDLSHPKKQFKKALSEALDGLATADGQQPMDLFRTFARALRVLGNRLGIGPLQDKLKEKGIIWKKSADGQDLILTIKNAETNSEQPVARINYETLQNPTDFQEQLKNMLDFAMGQAPGAFSQQEREIQDRKKTISDIAKAIKPMDDESEVAKQMNVGLSQEKTAAQTAALPKIPSN